ncbi:MAG: 3-methyl-2-oxobutanoate hydroxymethyltransferase [Phycisphaerales bacterium]|nr:3-methyl-2-oxobutanoate hydroxymethyltransferase [Phycisphaerales bacterium]
MLTCYDATTARWLAQAGVPALLVGDSAAQVILGHEQSIFAPLDFLITLTAGVRRGAPNCLLMGDMPFMSYQADDAQAIRNAGRFMVEGQADLVKLEVDGRHAELVGKLSRAGIPVVAHLGWKPQQVRYAGIRTALVAGRTMSEIQTLVTEAQIMEDQGAVMLLVEQCTAEASEAVIAKVSLPVIGCGAGPACHGHVVVLQDLLGMSEHHPLCQADGAGWSKHHRCSSKMGEAGGERRVFER